MTYRKYFSDNQTQREFFDSIAGQCSKRTMSADDHGLFVEYEKREPAEVERLGVIWRWNRAEEMTRSEWEYWTRHILPFGWAILSVPPVWKSDSGQLSSFSLPMAVAAIAMYLMHFMAAHGILQSLTMIGGR